MSVDSGNARLGVAVVGAGTASGPHFLALADLAAELELRWVIGRSPERLAALTLPSGARTNSRLTDALADPAVQLVLVLTPPNTHLEIVSRLAAAGKHVLVEKPLELDLARAGRLVAACEQHGVRLAVMLQHRQREGALALAALVACGDLGRLVSASASVRWWRPQAYYDVPGRGTLARDGGGVLMTQAIHTLDLLLCLTGLPDRVTALATTSPAHTMECEDTVAAVLRFGNGAIGSIAATTAAYPGFAERIALDCSAGSATLEAGELQVSWSDGRTLHAGARQASGAGANLMAFDHIGHRAVLQDLVAALRGQREPAVSGRSALRVHRLIDALMASARTQAPVDIAP